LLMQVSYYRLHRDYGKKKSLSCVMQLRLK
jgi:hypothetical protein